MAPVKDDAENGRIGPPTSFIQVAKPYIFEQSIQECLKTTGVSQAREDTIRLAGVQWIDSVRKALKLLQLPMSKVDEMLTWSGPFGRLTPP
jgi:CTD kinase subunit beta